MKKNIKNLRKQILTLISAALPDLRSDEFRLNGDSLLASLLGGVLVEGFPHVDVFSVNVFERVGDLCEVAGVLRDNTGLLRVFEDDCRTL